MKNPLLRKLFAAGRLTRRGSLADATLAIQRALAANDRSANVVAEAPVARTATSPSVARAGTDRFSASSYTDAAGTRTFKLFEPSGFAGKSLPLVVMLHGCTQDPDDFAAGTRMNERAQEAGFLVLYPAQAPRSNAHKCWNWFTPGDQRRGEGEPALIAGMTRHVIETHAVDRDRVYVAGLSAGAAMAAILAREYPDLFAAAGIHSGLPPGAAHDVASAFTAMKSGSAAAPSWQAAMNAASASLWGGSGSAGAVPASNSRSHASAPVIVFHGDADTTVSALNGDAVIAAALAVDAGAVRAESAGAARTGARSFARTVFRAADADAKAPSLAEQWVVHGAPHAWSGGAAAGSFTDPAGPDASVEMLRFFREHPRRAGSA